VTTSRVYLDSVYAAIADPTRRAILAALARGDLTVGAIADRFPISFNGVSKHVKVLERAGLVTRRVEGREHWVRIRPAPLGRAADWLEEFRVFWEARLDALEAMLVEPSSPGQHTKSRRTPRTRK
jgi:DNA-binding transcriptional ArsR family regulator